MSANAHHAPLPAAFVAPMSHLDLTFMGSVEECLSRGAKVFTGVLDLLERQPDYRFLLEYVVFLEAYRALQPAQAARLDEHIRAGRVELGAEWSGIFALEDEEEDLIRNVLYAKRYARERYGLDLETLQLSDIPGVFAQLPQVCAGLGIQNLVVTRCAPPDTLFWFAAPNGDRVLTWSADQYNEAGRLGMHLGTAAMRERGLAERLGEGADSSTRTASERVPPLFYYGSDLFLPAPGLALAAQEWTANGKQALAITTPTGYFRALRAHGELLEHLQERAGELPSTWLYVEPDHAHVSRWDGIAARALDAAERLSTLAWLRLGRSYPRDELETLWKTQLLARDHNYGGKGAGEGQPRKLAERREVYSRARKLLARAMGAIAEQVAVPRESVPVVVFNPLNWERGGIVRAHVTYYPAVDPAHRDLLPRDQTFLLKDPDGVTVPYQVTADRRTTLGEFDIAFLARQVPALGYAAYTLVPADLDAAAVAEAQASRHAPRRTDQQWFGATPPDVVLENGLVRLAISRATGQASVYDLRGAGEGALATGGSGTAAPMPGLRAPQGGAAQRSRARLAIARLRLDGRHELPEVTLSPPRALSYDAPERETTEPAQLAGDDPVTVVEQGPVMVTAAVRQTVLGAPAEIRYTLTREVPWVDVEVRLDWDVRRFGRVELTYDAPDAEAAHYGLPFGAGRLAADALLPGSGPVRGDEAPPASWKETRQIARWLSLEGVPGGVVMATDHRWTRIDPVSPSRMAPASRQGAAGESTGSKERDGEGSDSKSGDGMRVRCCLVRGGRIRAASPDTDGDDQRVRLGFHFRLIPTSGTWREARAHRIGWEAVQPLLSYTVNDTWSPKALPESASLLSVAASGDGDALLTCLKQSEDGEGVVARWYEGNGAPCTVEVGLPGTEPPILVDLQEQPLASPTLHSNTAAVSPWQIVTVRAPYPAGSL